MNDTATKEYAEYLLKQELVPWKQWLHVQLPYRMHLHHLRTGRTLDIGCGIGRNLIALENSLGVDHNPHCIDICHSRGLTAYLPEALHANAEEHHGSFDSLLLSHILEHMQPEDAEALLLEYLPYLKPQGKIIIITPQEAGYRADKTHVTFVDFTQVDRIFKVVSAQRSKAYSFPFPRFVGCFFKHNEFVSIAEIGCRMSIESEL